MSSTDVNIHLHDDSTVAVERESRSGTCWIGLTVESASVTIFGSDAQLDGLTSQLNALATDRSITVNADPIDWERTSEDALALRGAYDPEWNDL